MDPLFYYTHAEIDIKILIDVCRHRYRYIDVDIYRYRYILILSQDSVSFSSVTKNKGMPQSHPESLTALKHWLTQKYSPFCNLFKPTKNNATERHAMTVKY